MREGSDCEEKAGEKKGFPGMDDQTSTCSARVLCKLFCSGVQITQNNFLNEFLVSQSPNKIAFYVICTT